MPIKYPASLDDDTSLKKATDGTSNVSSGVVNASKDAIKAVEAELGVKPSGTYTTVRARLEALEASLAAALAEVSNINLEIAALDFVQVNGDLGGTETSPLVVGIQGVEVNDAAPNYNEVLTYIDGYEWVPFKNSVDIFYPPLSLIFDIDVPIFELGQDGYPTFTASFSYEHLRSLVLTDDVGGTFDVLSDLNAFTTTDSYTSTTIGDTVVFTLEADGYNDQVVTEEVTLSFGQKIFYGIGATGGNSEAFIEALSDSELSITRLKSFDITSGSGDKVYFAYPTSLGAADPYIDGVGSLFTLVSDSISVTNANGYADDYSLYESNADDLGSVTITIL